MSGSGRTTARTWGATGRTTAVSPAAAITGVRLRPWSARCRATTPGTMPNRTAASAAALRRKGGTRTHPRALVLQHPPRVTVAVPGAGAARFDVVPVVQPEED